jgi:hypothetical protein
MFRRIAIGVAVLVLLAGVAAVAWTSRRATGYYGAVFSPDGESIYAIERSVNASVVGLGYDTLTPPASVWIHRDRFRLVAIRLNDRHVTLVREFPASPLEGARISAYHGAIYGEASGHLRWADSTHLEYEVTVTRPGSPSSRTFVWRHRWSPRSATFTDSTSWQPGVATMSGDEPAQLSGDREVLAVRGPENMGCAIVVLRTGAQVASAIEDTGQCGDRFSAGFTRDVLESRRAAIERAALVQKTYADLVAQGRAQGLSEGAAMLQANKGMQRLGLYPKTPTVTATAAMCDALQPIFHISDEEFRVGLFQDLERAIEHPGEESDFHGEYVTHRDFNTSHLLNDFLSDRGHREFFVDGHGGCWRMRIDHR